MTTHHRPTVRQFLVLSFVIVLGTFVFSGPNRAQEKSQAKPEPSPSPAGGAQKQGKEVPENTTLSTNTDLVNLTVTVTDTYGRYVSGLNKNAFAIFDEKQPQEITFFSDDDAPVSVGVVFDVSGSMSGDKIRRARDALSRFIQTSHNSD